MHSTLKLCAFTLVVSIVTFLTSAQSLAQGPLNPGESPVPFTGVVWGSVDLVCPFGDINGPTVDYLSDSTIHNGTNLFATFYQTIQIHETTNDDLIDGVTENYILSPTTQKTDWVTERSVSLVEDDYIVSGVVGWFSSPGVSTQLDYDAEFFTVDNN